MTPEPDPRMTEALIRLEAALVAGGAPVVEHLRPGLPAGEVAGRLEEAGLRATADLLSWFGWHDGCSSFESYGPERGFLSDHPFLGLAETLGWRAGDDGRLLLEAEQELHGWRPEDVLPFLTDPVEAQTLGLAVRNEDHQRVWLGHLEDPDHVPYGTLVDFGELLATAWEQGVVRYVDGDDALFVDQRALERLRAERLGPPAW